MRATRWRCARFPCTASRKLMTGKTVVIATGFTSPVSRYVFVIDAVSLRRLFVLTEGNRYELLAWLSWDEELWSNCGSVRVLRALLVSHSASPLITAIFLSTSNPMGTLLETYKKVDRLVSLVKEGKSLPTNTWNADCQRYHTTGAKETVTALNTDQYEATFSVLSCPLLTRRRAGDSAGPGNRSV